MIVLAAIALPCTTLAADAPGGARILYFEPFHSLAAPTRPGAHKTSRPGLRQLSFDAYGRRFELSLETNDRLMNALGNGALAKTTPSSSLRLYRGRVDGDPRSWARLAVKREEVHGMIWDGSDLYVIEPAAQVATSLVPPLDAGADTVIFRLSDVLMDASATACAIDDAQVAAHDGKSKGDAAYGALVRELKNAKLDAALGPSRQLKMSVLSDALFLRDYANEGDARDALLVRLNDVDGIFSSQLGIEIDADAVFVNDEASDPLSSVTAPNSLLAELGRLRKRTPQLSARGLTHLFTGRELDGATVGIAYMDSLCDATYGVALTQAQSAWRDALVAAHEIGHNFGADHDGDPEGSCPSTHSDFLMSASLSGTDTFSPCSLARMQQVAQAASCITDLAPADVVLPADLGTVRQPLSKPFEWTLEITNAGGRTAADVHAELQLPPALLIDDAYVVGGSCISGAGTIQCQMGDLRGDATQTIHLTLHSDVLGSNSISARVFSPAEAFAGSSSEGTILIEREADIALSMQGPASASPERPFDVGYSVASRAMIGIDDITLVINLPDGVTATNASLGGSSCVGSGTQIHCTLPSLAAGGIASGRMSVEVSAGGNIVLRSRVSGGYIDPNASNDQADLAIDVSPRTEEQTGPLGGQGGGGSSGGLLLFALLALERFRRCCAPAAQVRSDAGA